MFWPFRKKKVDLKAMDMIIKKGFIKEKKSRSNFKKKISPESEDISPVNHNDIFEKSRIKRNTDFTNFN